MTLENMKTKGFFGVFFPCETDASGERCGNVKKEALKDTLPQVLVGNHAILFSELGEKTM